MCASILGAGRAMNSIVKRIALSPPKTQHCSVAWTGSAMMRISYCVFAFKNFKNQLSVYWTISKDTHHCHISIFRLNTKCITQSDSRILALIFIKIDLFAKPIRGFQYGQTRRPHFLSQCHLHAAVVADALNHLFKSKRKCLASLFHRPLWAFTRDFHSLTN